MKEKINYHLTALFSEIKHIISTEISNSIKLTIESSRKQVVSQPLLTTDEVAAVLKVSKSHINKLRKKYIDFPVLNIDGSIRFRQSEVEDFFKTFNTPKR